MKNRSIRYIAKTVNGLFNKKTVFSGIRKQLTGINISKKEFQIK